MVATISTMSSYECSILNTDSGKIQITGSGLQKFWFTGSGAGPNVAFLAGIGEN